MCDTLMFRCCSEYKLKRELFVFAYTIVAVLLLTVLVEHCNSNHSVIS